MRSFCTTLLILLTFLSGTRALAQDPQAGEPAPSAAAVAARGPDDALGRGTPRSSALGFLKACGNLDFELASEYLDLRNLPEDVAQIGGAELARQLNHVLSRSVWLDDYNVSDKPEGMQGDGLPSFRDLLVTIHTPDGKIPIWLQQVPRDDGERIWKISNRSVARIPELYAAFSYSPLVERIRNWFPEGTAFLGIELFKWFIMAALGLLCWPAYYLLGRILSRLFSSPDRHIYPFVRRFFTGPLVAIGILITVAVALDRLGAGPYAQKVMQAKTIVTAVFVWAIWALVSLFRESQRARLEGQGRPGAAKLVRPMTTFVKLLVLIIGLLFWLDNLGVNISTVLAGLGVGGLAMALALQRPLEDMMGALTIFTQAPIRVGDFCRYGEITGVVEDIGLRTTRLRTLTNTLVSIPNSRIAYVEVENFTARRMIRYWPTLRLRYDTTPDQLRRITAGTRKMLEAHERVHEEPLRVRFTDLADDALLVKVHCFLRTRDFTESLEIAEDINLRVMDIVQEAGARFALPGRSIYLEGEAAAT